MIEEIKSRIKSLLYSYGIIPLLITLNEQEIKENYEMCALILESIKEVFPEHDAPTRYGRKALDWVNKEHPMRDIDWVLKTNLNKYVNHVYNELSLKRTYSIKLTL